MERISIFDIFKIGVGPSSSHTLGPWQAARKFQALLIGKKIKALEVQLFGSLSKTGVGHATDIAVMLGLQDYDPETIPTQEINAIISGIKENKQIKIQDQYVAFNPASDIVFSEHFLPFHPNAMSLKAVFEDAQELEETYYSIGGGFIVQEDEQEDEEAVVKLPYPIDKGQDILDYAQATGMRISDIVFENELAFGSNAGVKQNIKRIFNTMLECVYRGCQTGGILPGGLNVKRRAKQLSESLLGPCPTNNVEEWLEAIQSCGKEFATINSWVSCFALAVNEENAALGRIVTSPTNGAAGVIPAVLLYHHCFGQSKGDEDIFRFLLAAGEIGCLFKKGATISAAMGGCQAEIGVSSAMAAAGLTEVMGGSPGQVLMAAEIAMEHHLGLTCDPVGGLVQIPCIERNAMGAMKAITACNLALVSKPEDALVDLDAVIKTMWDTAQDMHHNYKETSEGGLAINLPVILPDC